MKQMVYKNCILLGKAFIVVGVLSVILRVIDHFIGPNIVPGDVLSLGGVLIVVGCILLFIGNKKVTY